MSLVVGQMKGLSYMQYLEYQMAVSTFLRIQAFNTSIKTQRLAGNTSVSYYVFQSQVEELQFKQGRILLLQNDPTNASTYTPVEKV